MYIIRILIIRKTYLCTFVLKICNKKEMNTSFYLFRSWISESSNNNKDRERERSKVSSNILDQGIHLYNHIHISCNVKAGLLSMSIIWIEYMNSKIDPLYETRYTRGCTSIYIWIYFKRIDRQARTTKDNGLFRTNCSMDGEQTDRHNIYINVLLLYSIKDIYKIVAYLKCKNVNPLSMV
jgi:hypothetical protein